METKEIMRFCPSLKECPVRAGSDFRCEWFPDGHCTFPHPAVKSSYRESEGILARVKGSLRTAYKRP